MLKFHLFCGMEYARIPVRASLRKRKKARNSVPKHFVEEKNTQNFVILFGIIPWKKKCCEFHS
jgi:hypothetical protein